MVSFRFPFSFPQPPKPPSSATADASSRTFPTISAALSIATATAAAGAAVVISQNPNNTFLQTAMNFLARDKSSSSFTWGSLSLSDNWTPITESRTQMSFPAVLGDSQRLLGVGLRRKAALGLKNIDVYAFGVYADDSDVKELLSEKYGSLSVSELKGNEKLKEDLMESDVNMTIRLQLVYGRLSIKSVRSAFQESVGSRLQRFGGSDNKELLERFTSQFRDEYKIPRGSIIDMSRDQGYVLRTIINGKEVGSIQSKLLCRSILDLYIGSEPFDPKAKEDVEQNLAFLLGK